MDRDHRASLADGETPSAARLNTRLSGRLAAGGIGGAATGLALGGIIGVLAFDRTGAILACVLGCGIFGLAVGLLIFGYSSLESPDPGSEPSDTERPITDRPEAVRVEQPPTPIQGSSKDPAGPADGI